MADMDRDPTPHVKAFDHSHTQHLVQALHYQTHQPGTPQRAMRERWDILTNDIMRWCEDGANRDIFFTYNESRGAWECVTCGLRSSNWHGHTRSSHPLMVWNAVGFRMNLEQWKLLEDMILGNNGNYRLYGVIHQDIRPGILDVIANNIKFYKGVIATVKAMTYKDLHAIVVDPETNRCRGCGQQVKGLREHVIESHLDDIGFEIGKPAPKPRPPSQKKYYTRASSRGRSSYNDIWGNS